MSSLQVSSSHSQSQGGRELCSDTMSPVELLQRHQPMYDSMNLTNLNKYDWSKPSHGFKPAPYTIRSIKLDSEFVQRDDQIFKSALILSSLVSLDFHELTNLRSSTERDITKRITSPLSLIILESIGKPIRICLDPQEISEESIERLLDSINAQLDIRDNASTTAFSSSEPILLLDFSNHQQQQEESNEGLKSIFVIKPKDYHLVLTVDSNPLINVEPILASWFLLHTVNLYNKIMKFKKNKNLNSKLKTNSMLTELEKKIILKNNSSLSFNSGEKISRSNSLVEIILKSAEINSSLIAVHWYERYNNNNEFEFKLNFKQFANYSYLISEHIIKFKAQYQDNQIIMLLMSKNPWLILILFAVSLSGFTYLNVELNTPTNKIKSILKNLNIPLVLTFSKYDQCDFIFNKNQTNQRKIKDEIDFDNVLDLSEFCTNLQNQIMLNKNVELKRPREILKLYEERARREERNLREEIVYIVYTSGTTGEPKAIKISNSNLVHFLYNYSNRFQRKNDGLTRVLQFASYSFDVSVMSIWDTLAHGSTICMTTNEHLKSDLIGSIIDLNCTTVDLTPTVLNIIIEDDELFKSTENLKVEQVKKIWNSKGFKLNHLNTGSEFVSVELRKKFLSRGVTVCTDYGPSETTVGTISSLILNYDPDVNLDDIGRPTGLNEVYLLDTNLELVPLGGIGEICIGGGQVSTGYLDKDLSVGKFVDVYLDGDKPTRIYRTGDLGRFLPTGSEGYGSIRFLGRMDSQVKISGVRIELGEVEKVINQLVDQLKFLHGHHIRTVISKWIGDENRSAGLVCFIELNSTFWKTFEKNEEMPKLLSSSNDNELKILNLTDQYEEWFNNLIIEIRNSVSQDLSRVMIPHYWIPVNKIPINFSGKVDRKELNNQMEIYFNNMKNSFDSNLIEMEKYERIASDAWWIGLGHSEPLRRLKGTDNFIKLGGDSIGMMRVIGKIRKDGMNVKFSNLTFATEFSNFVQILKEEGSNDEEILAQNKNLNQELVHDVPFELINQTEKDEILAQLRSDYSVLAEEIEDCFPTSPSQTGIISASLEENLHSNNENVVGVYFSQAIYKIESIHTSNETIIKNILQLISTHSTLRTIFILPKSSNQIFQVILNFSSQKNNKNFLIVRVNQKEEFQSTINDYLREDRKENKFDWGRSSLSIRIFESEDGEERSLVWSMHHALSDGWTLELLTKELSELCHLDKNNQEQKVMNTKPITKYRHFVQAWKDRDERNLNKIKEFWKVYLDGVQRRSVECNTNQQRGKTWIGGGLKLEEIKKRYGITPSMVISLAVAISLNNTGIDGPDVLFGLVRNGREIELNNQLLAQDIIGCCVSILPIRFNFSNSTYSNSKLLDVLLLEKHNQDEINKNNFIHLSELGRFITGFGHWINIILTIQSFKNSTKYPIIIKQPPQSIHMPTNFYLSIEITLPENLDDGIKMDLFFNSSHFISNLHNSMELSDLFLNQLISNLNQIHSNLNQNINSLLVFKDRLNQNQQQEESRFENKNKNDQDEINLDKNITKMKEIWMDILEINNSKDILSYSFENLGGDSIKMMRLIRKIKLDFSVADLDFEKTNRLLVALKNGIPFIDFVKLI